MSKLFDFDVEIPENKTPISIRIDESVLAWYKTTQPKGYQSLMNAVLKKYMEINKQKE